MKTIISLKTLLFAATIALAGFFAQAESALYPTKIIERPGIMPRGMIQIDINAKMTGLKTVNLGVSTQFGIVKKLQGEFSYDGFDFNEFAVKKVTTLGAKYDYLSSIPHISFSATAKLPIHIYDGEIIRDITFGLPVTFYNDLMAGGILKDVFHLTMRDKIAMEFAFPFWYGIQVYGNWWAQLDSSFGTVEMKKENNANKWTAVGFWKNELTIIYAFNHCFDLSGNFGYKNILKPEKDNMFFGLTLSARAGRILG